MNLQKIRSALSRGNMTLLVAYLFFAVLPHFAAITHTHAGGNGAHTHSSFGARDENLGREALENLGSTASLKTVALPAVASEEVSPALIPLERGAQGLQSANFRHTHFQEDPNLLALGVTLALPLIAMALRKAPAFAPSFVPSLLKFRPVARGPPVFSSLV